MPCLHCKADRRLRSRGLCYTCYEHPEIRAQYPTLCRHWLKHHDETMEEVEALIAEQRRCLPKWWDRETVREWRIHNREEYHDE